jgi:predicted RNase H-like nuclease (RuvC/YqgF family)
MCGGSVTAQIAPGSATPAPERKQLLEEKQISRMILEIEHNRDSISSLAEENDKLWGLVKQLDRQIEELIRIAELHKKASGDRARALELKDKAENLYKQSLKDAEKRISKLEAQNGFLRKLVLIAFAVGTALGAVSR